MATILTINLGTVAGDGTGDKLRAGGDKINQNFQAINTELGTLPTTYQPLDADLTAIAGLVGNTGFLKKTAANTWSLDTNSYALDSHNHTGVYEPVITKATGYLKWTGSAWQFVNETYSLSTHDHSGTYEPVLTAGTSAQYYRGDKTWQTLNTTAVAEGTNLYFTDARVRSAVLTGYTATSGTISATDTVLQAIQKLGFDKHVAVTLGTANGLTLSGQQIGLGTASSSTTGALTSTDWSTFNNKQATISLTTTGSSGASTFNGTTLNVPNYTLSGLGGFANPMTTLGDVIYGAASGTATRLAGNITTAKQYLSQTGNESASAAPSWSAIAGSDVTGAALTKTDDTNVTLTLGGSASTSLLRAASITVGWSGQLSVGRGGTGASTLTGILVGNGTSAITAVTGTASQLLRRNSGNTAYEFFTPSYLTAAITSLGGLTVATQTFSNDTNVTITSNTSTHTLGWTGQLAVGRGGSGASTLTGVLIGNGTSAFTGVAGTANQLLRRNGTNTAYEFFTPSYLISETDPVYTGSSWYTTTNNSSNWNTAYGWGNHAGLYEGLITKSTGYLRWTGSAWEFKNETYSLSTHTHGNITNAGAIGSTSGLPIITTTSGVLTTGSFGTSSGTFCQGNDSRLSDNRTPTDDSVTYAKVATNLKSSATISSTVNLSSNGIGIITLSANTSFTFTNFELNKTFLLIITANNYTPSFAQGSKHILVEGNATMFSTGVYYISLTCINATSGSEKLLTVIMKGA
jgi:hypothetical protein